MELSATAKVICGMIRLGRRTGYEIKQVVDLSTRFFWAASYGQIYPELRRLEEQGLIVSEDGAGADGRQRRPYELTPAGRDALGSWLRSPAELVYEHRDEGKLKLFFSDELEPGERLELVRSMRATHEQRLEQLRPVEEGARKLGGGPHRTIRYGLAMHEFCAGWLTELEQEIEADLTARR